MKHRRIDVCSLRGRRARGSYSPGNDTRGWEAFPDSIHRIASSIPPPSNALLSPTITPMFIGTNERERCPSLAPSADSAESWEGASDIYDDCQYSRFSMASKMSMSSRFSVNAASGVVPTPPVPESRPSIDSNASRLRVDSTRSRGDSLHSRTDSAFAAPITAGSMVQWKRISPTKTWMPRRR